MRSRSSSPAPSIAARSTPIDPEPLFDVLHGALFSRIVGRQDLSTDFPDVLVDLVLKGLGAHGDRDRATMA